MTETTTGRWAREAGVREYKRRTQPEVRIRAVRLTADNGARVWEWADSKPHYEGGQVTGLSIYTEFGRQKARFGDWVIQHGERFWAVPDRDFADTYEPIDGAA